MVLGGDVWLRSRNMTRDMEGSIHDDRGARSVGFRSALIGASVHSAFVTKVAAERLGPAWYERGFVKQTYLHPLYEGDEFRILMEDAATSIAGEALVNLAFETREGVRTTAGYVGLGPSAERVCPPWLRPEERRPEPPPPDDCFTFQRAVTIEESADRRAVANDRSPWYETASPWGRPIVPMFMHLLLGAVRPPPESPTAMASVWELLQTGPMFAGDAHVVSSKTVAKGIAGRAGYRTTEFAVDAASGRRIAIARQTVRWLPPR